MKAIRDRIEIANFHRGGILMTTLVLLAGSATPRILKRVATVLAHLLRRMDA